MKEKVELLAPAGDLSKLRTALKFGADAIYVGGESFGLRKASKNFTTEDLKIGIEEAHACGKKVYVTMNIIPHNEDFEGVEEYVALLGDLNVDALIVADPGMYTTIRSVNPTIPIHISTQSNITNAKTVDFWHKLGATRTVLARELSLEEIKGIRTHIDDEMELEMFVHGAMCISYSGRCLLSNYMASRDANKGDCAHACRWKYNLVEEKRPGEYFPIEESDGGSFILNSKDLCLLRDIPRLIEAGVNSFKIEGRVKSQYYVATVVRSYRLAIDAYYDGTFTAELADGLIDEIRKASHRDFTTGFLNDAPGTQDHNYASTSYIRGYDFIGQVMSYDPITSTAVVEQRNKFAVGEEVELFGVSKEVMTFNIEGIVDKNNRPMTEASLVQEFVTIPVPGPCEVGDMLRRAI